MFLSKLAYSTPLIAALSEAIFIVSPTRHRASYSLRAFRLTSPAYAPNNQHPSNPNNHPQVAHRRPSTQGLLHHQPWPWRYHRPSHRHANLRVHGLEHCYYLKPPTCRSTARLPNRDPSTQELTSTSTPGPEDDTKTACSTNPATVFPIATSSWYARIPKAASTSSGATATHTSGPRAQRSWRWTRTENLSQGNSSRDNRLSLGPLLIVILRYCFAGGWRNAQSLVL
jgi:hypothetical protein